MNGITYFRLKSQYPGDITKNCALTGNEIDNNFNVLEGRDIDSLEIKGDEIILKLKNGEVLKARDAFKDECVTDISFDKTNGVLKIDRNGEIEEIEGFATSFNTGNAVSVDNTLQGNGLASNPVGISPVSRTGQYRPVERIIKISDGELLPEKNQLVPGDRYLTEEQVSNYGYLYNYNGVKKIACDLRDAHSPWRIPTKEDWDDMLNGVEPCSDDKTHSSATANKYLGKWAGKLLKSVDLWRPEHDDDEDCHPHPHPHHHDCFPPHPHHPHHMRPPYKPMDEENDTCIDYNDETNCQCGNSGDINYEMCSCGHNKPCEPTYCGEYGHCHHKPKMHDNRGLDKYGFRVTPAGYADDGCNFGFFKERACFWTATNSNCSNAYVKRFDFDKSSVHQDVIASQHYLSLRLVKDFNGDNYNEREDILGVPYSTVLMPSEKHGKAVWTSINVNFGNKCYFPVMPNDGQGMSFSRHYYINEWDGKKWLRNEVKEGESVVVRKAPHHQHDIEFRVIKGDLVNVMNYVYNRVIDTVSPILKGMDAKINDEIKRSTDKDEELEGRIVSLETSTADLTERMDKAEADIVSVNARVDDTNNALADTNRILDEFKAETAENFDKVHERITTNVKILSDAIQAETEARIEADEELKQKDIELEKKIDDNYNDLSEKIATEVNERKEADEALNKKIDDEIERSTKEDEEIRGRLISKEGSTFVCEEGLLTLVTDNPENTIVIKLNGNYGTF